jgi:hypothetical protein
MIFPNYKYKEFNNTNKSEWPIESWCEMIKLSSKYCSNLEDIFEFEQYCRSCDLPSEHPYWKLQSLKRRIELIDYTRGFISQTKLFISSNPGNRYVSNAYSSINNQEKSIQYYCSNMNL